jgi:CelD/BcsL family acetyltransferase involved in cellulose biosynthesis
VIEVINTLAGLYKLKSDWTHLGNQFDSPLLQFDWFYSCAENLHKESDLYILVSKSNNTTNAIAPMVLQKHSMSTWLELLGSSTLYEPSGLLYDSIESLGKLIEAMIISGYPTNLKRIPLSSPIVEYSRRFSRKKAVTISRPSAGSFYITMDNDWNSFYSTIGKNWRSDFRNKNNRARKLGDVNFVISCPKGDQLIMDIKKVIDIEHNSWKGKRGSSLYKNSILYNFFTNYAKRTSENNLLRICFFNINNESIAMNLGVEYANKLWFFKTGFNDQWSHISPGMLINMESIKYAFENGILGYEFLGSEEKWQQAWPVKSHNYCSIVILPYSIKSIFAYVEILLNFAKSRLLIKSLNT